MKHSKSYKDLSQGKVWHLVRMNHIPTTFLWQILEHDKQFFSGRGCIFLKFSCPWHYRFLFKNMCVSGIEDCNQFIICLHSWSESHSFAAFQTLSRNYNFYQIRVISCLMITKCSQQYILVYACLKFSEKSRKYFFSNVNCFWNQMCHQLPTRYHFDSLWKMCLLFSFFGNTLLNRFRQ